MTVGSYITKIDLVPWNLTNSASFDDHGGSRGRGEQKYEAQFSGSRIVKNKHWDIELVDGGKVQIKELIDDDNEIRAGTFSKGKITEINVVVDNIIYFAKGAISSSRASSCCDVDKLQEFLQNEQKFSNQSYSHGALFGNTTKNPIGLLQALQELNLAYCRGGWKPSLQYTSDGSRNEKYNKAVSLFLNPLLLEEFVKIPASVAFSSCDKIVLVHEIGFKEIDKKDFDSVLKFNRISKGDLLYKINV